MAPGDKPLVWLHGEVKSPPFSLAARVHELRIQDERATWRIIYRLDPDAVVIAEVFSKRTQTTLLQVIKVGIRRLRAYDDATRED